MEELTDNDDDSEENSDDSSEVDSDEDADDDSDVSIEEIEIEVMDRDVQTEIVKSRMDKIMVQGHSKADVRNRSAQTESDFVEASVKAKLTSEKVKEIDSNLLNMMIDSLLPFKLVEQDSFKTFCKSLETKYHFPKVKKLVGETNKRYDSLRSLLELELKGTDSSILTHDLWSTFDGQTYISIMAHYITNKWRLTSVILSTCAVSQEQHDSFSAVIQKVVTDWKLPTPIRVKSAALSSLESLEFERVTCLGHCLRSLAKDCLNHKHISPLVEKGRNFVRALQNICLRDDLKKDQKADLTAMLEFHKLGQDDPNLWNTTLDMLSGLSGQSETIRDVVKKLKLNSVDIDTFLYSDEDITVIKSVVLILSQFKTAAEILTAYEITTAEKVLPTLIKLQKALTEVTNELPSIHGFKSDLRKQINSVILHSKEIFLLSCIVHPQTKQMLFVTPEEMTHAKLLLFDEMANIFRKGMPAKPVSNRTEEEMSDGGSRSVSNSGEKMNSDKLTTLKERTEDSIVEDGKIDSESMVEHCVKDLNDPSVVKSDSVDQSSSDETKLFSGKDVVNSEVVNENQSSSDFAISTSTSGEQYAHSRVTDDEMASNGSTEDDSNEKMEIVKANLSTEAVHDSQGEGDNEMKVKGTTDICTNKEIDIQANTLNKEEGNIYGKSDLNSSVDNNKSQNITRDIEELQQTNNSERKNNLISNNKDCEAVNTKEKTSTMVSNDTKKKLKSDNTDWLEDVIGTGELQNQSPEEKAKIELDLYLAEPPVKTNALIWWKKKQLIFPTVSKVARRLLAVPASSLSLSDIFSFKEGVVDAKKSQLDPKHIDALLFLNKNTKIFKESTNQA